jgi:putative hemolysin
MARLGRVPNTGDRFDYDGFRFEVLDMDRHRVDKVLVSPSPQAATPAAAGVAPEGRG